MCSQGHCKRGREEISRARRPFRYPSYGPRGRSRGSSGLVASRPPLFIACVQIMEVSTLTRPRGGRCRYLLVRYSVSGIIGHKGASRLDPPEG